jgi:K(+)-stimulated pyrophosphate-energized sodium pump
VDIGRVPVFVGALLGAMLVFLFSSYAIKAVGKAAYSVIEEVRRQFRENPGIMAGTSKPDYGRCVDIVTVGALKAMVVPGLLAVGMPVVVGLLFRHLTMGEYGPEIGAESVAALLMVGTIAGILLATLMNNGGGAWDNAKKFIETGQYGGRPLQGHRRPLAARADQAAQHHHAGGRAPVYLGHGLRPTSGSGPAAAGRRRPRPRWPAKRRPGSTDRG